MSYFALTERFLILIILIATGCSPIASTFNSSGSSNPSSSPTPSPSPSLTPSARAVKVILYQSSTNGSFDPSPSTGTSAVPGSGQQVQRLFNPNNTLLASTTNPTNWPVWFTSFEIGISGSANTSAQNPNCAIFANSGESSQINCNLSGTNTCGATIGQFRVSEADCNLNSATPTLAGNGGPSDGIYMRAVFNRSPVDLGLSENILVILEYSVSFLDQAPANPSTCFNSTTGTLSAEQCSDFTWRAYLKHSPSEIVQPFLLLVPPSFSSVLPTSASGNNSTAVLAKQFILPMASDSLLTTLQISHTNSNFSSPANLTSYCATGGLPANSAFCAGIVFYSISFYRI